MVKIICNNCQTELNGKYCHQCGEKTVDDHDFSFKNIVGQAVGELTSLDSRLFKTLKLLLLHPGKLTVKFVEGFRVPYMKPFQIFVLSNVIFFIFLSQTDLFRTPSQWFFVENFDGIRVLETVRQIQERTGADISKIASDYDNQSSNLAKGLIVLLIPFIAIIGLLLFYKKNLAFGKHMVFATHYFSFVLLICVVISEILMNLPITANRWFFIIPISFSLTLYYVLAIKNFYHPTWFWAIVKGIIGVAGILFLIQMYRIGISLISLHTLG